MGARSAICDGAAPDFMIDGLRLSLARTLPVMLGTEAAECGLVCLTMISRYHGHNVDLNGLRQRFSISLAGASLRSIMDQADTMSFSTRALRLELEDLSKVKTPAILHWDMDHYVVLKSVSRSKVTIHDPARGMRHLPIKEVSKHFTGVALELTPTKVFKPVEARAKTRIQDLWSSIDGFWGILGHILLLSVALQVVAFAMPFQMQLVVDDAIFRGDRDLLGVLAIAFGGLFIVQAVISAIRGWTMAAVGQMLSFQMIGNLVRHVMRLPADWFEKRHVGDILSRIGSSGPIEDAITRGAIAAVLDGVMGLVAGAILFLYSPFLAFIVILGILLNLAVTLAFYPIMRHRMEESIVVSANEQSHLMETVRAATTIKLMGREGTREATWRNLFAETINTQFSMTKYQIAQGFIQSVIAGIQSVILVYLAAGLILDAKGFSVGMLYAFLSFSGTFTERINAFIAQMIQFRFLGLHLDRLGDIVQTKAENDGARPLLAAPRGGFEIKNLSFQYGSSDRLVLEDVNLKIEPGEFIAITGPSGAGKSTLCKLLLGLYPPTRGEIFLDNALAAPDLWRAWREHVGLVSQDDRLLSGTIADNIAFFDPALDMTRVREAALNAQVYEDIERMPMQFLSLVGDMGSILSGGQRQRVLLARALYRNPKVLILDEGTANLDADNEAAIADVIEAMPITRIVIAHRPALIERATRNFCVEHGRVFEIQKSARFQTRDSAESLAIE
jgi:ATP-binding cassette, subfamily B, bacterial CvaB/MchF/RaxB